MNFWTNVPQKNKSCILVYLNNKKTFSCFIILIPGQNVFSGTVSIAIKSLNIYTYYTYFSDDISFSWRRKTTNTHSETLQPSCVENSTQLSVFGQRKLQLFPFVLFAIPLNMGIGAILGTGFQHEIAQWRKKAPNAQLGPPLS